MLHMIMGLERLDRITAFMEEQSGPPTRSMDPVPEEAQEEGGPRQNRRAHSRSDSATNHPSSSAAGAKHSVPGVRRRAVILNWLCDSVALWI